MKILGSNSIRKTLQMVLLITSSAALTLTTLGFAVNDWISSRHQMMERMRSQAAIIGNNSVAALTFEDQDSAARTLASLHSETEIVAAWILTGDGGIFASYHRGRYPVSFNLPDNQSGSIDGRLYVQMPIELDAERVGTIVLLSDHTQWQEQQWFRAGIVLALFIMSLLVAALVSSRLQRLVTDPVLKLAQTARRITQNQDYSLRADKLSRDEIGRLADDFNEMVNQVQMRDNELKRAQEQLEEKVAERTAELEELANRFEHQAYHDSLTGLANRITFDHRLQESIDLAKRQNNHLSVLFLDLDRFKVINDTLGHALGDKLLIEVASRLEECLRSSDTLARLGGDEFAILLSDIEPGATGDVAAKVTESIVMPMLIDGHQLHLSTSIGISVFPGDGQDAATLLKNADTAMYRSKDKGRNCFTFFESNMNSRVERRLVLENKLRRAIKDSLFFLYYQPKRDCETLEITGVEALVRWRDSQEGWISPGEFIPLAEECGLIHAIDQCVLETACREIRQLQRDCNLPLHLSVNFSPSHFIHHDAAQQVAKTLQSTGYPGQYLELEITESLLGPDAGDVHRQLRAIRDQGVEVSIDDFGTAYSSLSRLKQLPLNTLKIDQSFVRDLGQDADDEILVRTIITLAHNLGLKVVAEGVETREQYEFVKHHHCDMVQGFLYGRPMPIEELRELLVERHDAQGRAS